MGNAHKSYGKWARTFYRVLIVISVLVLAGGLIGLYFFDEAVDGDYTTLPEQETVEGLHPTGFIRDSGVEVTVKHCTGCHSAQLVTQNRMSREGWLATIRWMQETQNLWDLGADENQVLDYLSKHYAPKEMGRRPPLGQVDWYELQ